MRIVLKLEEAAMFAFGLFLLMGFHLPWWLLLPLFFAPDLGALGYLAGPRVGAATYNTLHYKGIALALLGLGLIFHQPIFQIAGLLMFSHSSFDRVLGFGLKFADSFQNTHLGKIGKS
ncbi:MAG: DUF4260 family protein [Anaerolineales bacterium]